MVDERASTRELARLTVGCVFKTTEAWIRASLALELVVIVVASGACLATRRLVEKERVFRVLVNA